MKRILVVDDQAYVREILCELLANEPGLAVAGAGPDGWEAVALADRLEPDVVVMDLKMPEMNGADAAAAILTRHPTIRLPRPRGRPGYARSTLAESPTPTR